MEELWIDISGYEGHYQVSNVGNVRSMHYKGKDRLRVLKPACNKGGYLHVEFCVDKKRKCFLVHRLVAEAFIGNIPDGFTVNHKDGNKKNNDFHNLEIITQSQNNLHAIHALGKQTWNKGRVGRGMPRAIPVFMYKDGNMVREFGSIREAASFLDVYDTCIHDCLRGRQKTCKGYSFQINHQTDD